MQDKLFTLLDKHSLLFSLNSSLLGGSGLKQDIQICYLSLQNRRICFTYRIKGLQQLSRYYSAAQSSLVSLAFAAFCLGSMLCQSSGFTMSISIVDLVQNLDKAVCHWSNHHISGAVHLIKIALHCPVSVQIKLLWLSSCGMALACADKHHMPCIGHGRLRCNKRSHLHINVLLPPF